MNSFLPNTPDSPYKIIAHNPSATRKLLHDIDALLLMRIKTLAEQCGSKERASYLIESLVPYGRYVEVRKIVLLLRENPSLYSNEDVSYGLSCLTHTVDLLLGEIDNLLSDTERLELVQDVLYGGKPSPEQLSRYNDIAERRAYVRSLVAKLRAELKSEHLPEVEKSLLMNKLGMFSTLDNYPNIPGNENQAKELQSTLDILEPVLERLQAVFSQYQRKNSATSFYTDIVPQSKSSVVDSRLTVRSADRKVEPSIPKDTEVPPIPPARNGAQDIRRETTVPTSDSDVGLGNYLIQRGDTLADILAGHTAAGHFPIFYELTSQQRRQIIALTRKYLNNNPVLLTYINSPDTIDKVAHSNQEVSISLDALHDIVVYIAHEQNFIRIKDSTVQKFREMLRDNSRAEKQKKDTVATDSVRHFVVQNVYSKDEEQFLNDWLFWLQDLVSVQTESEHLYAIINLTYQQWKLLHSNSNQRYEWLRSQVMPLRVWNAWADAVRYLYSNLPPEQKNNMNELTLSELSQFVFAYQVYRSVAFQ